MITYVETNFLLEIILGQEEMPFANEIVALAQSKHVELLFPSFSLMEALWRIKGRGKDRSLIQSLLGQELNQLIRSSYHPEITQLIRELDSQILTIERSQLSRLQETFLHLFQVASPINLSNQVYTTSLSYQDKFNLSPQDAIVYASILSDLKKQNPTSPKLFISKNTKDFKLDAIKEELNTYNCRYLSKFEHALHYITSQL